MYCSKCGANVADEASFCGACGQPTGAGAVAQTQVAVLTPPSSRSQTVAAPANEIVRPIPQTPRTAAFLYAGFWLRVVAAIIDNLILGVPTALLFFLLFAGTIPMLMRGAGGNPMATMMIVLPRFATLAVISVVGRWLYWSLMEASEWQATLGKKALGLYVTDMEGRRATFRRTSGRFWAGRGISIVPYLGFLYYLIDCVMAGLTMSKQALHDMIANCLVLRKS
jgi:uncharacterized RDD family membrane protein YckC